MPNESLEYWTKVFFTKTRRQFLHDFFDLRMIDEIHINSKDLLKWLTHCFKTDFYRLDTSIDKVLCANIFCKKCRIPPRILS